MSIRQISRGPPTRADSDFYPYAGVDIARLLDKALFRRRITEQDYQLILEYVTELQAVGGIKPNRANKTVSLAINLRAHIGPYIENNLSDIYQGITNVRGRKYKGGPLKQNTLRDYLGFLKRFYLWMIEEGYSDLPKEKISQIKVPAMDTMTVTAADILTQEEVMALIRACQSSRDRAMISLLYEGGFRISELGKLTWGQVNFDEHGAVINVNLKTEKPRYVRIVASTPFLATWKNDYPFEPTEDSLVFLTAQRRAPSYEQMAAQIRKIAKRTGITKRVTPHIFRHSRITHLLEDGVSEPVVKQMMWGHRGTKMLAIYGHITSRDIDDALLSMHGITKA